MHTTPSSDDLSRLSLWCSRIELLAMGWLQQKSLEEEVFIRIYFDFPKMLLNWKHQAKLLALSMFSSQSLDLSIL